MSEFLVSRLIENNEILVRFIFRSDFKKKIIRPEKIIDAEVFFDSRGTGVSMQREKYCTENECKSKALSNINGYIGFVIFKKETFDLVQKLHQEKRGTFDAVVIATPLDEENNIIPEEKDIYSSDKGNPAHSDLIYQNPAPGENESPKTAIRVFSRKLFKESKLIIDSNNQEPSFNDCKFRDVVGF